MTTDIESDVLGLQITGIVVCNMVFKDDERPSEWRSGEKCEWDSGRKIEYYGSSGPSVCNAFTDKINSCNSPIYDFVSMHVSEH